MMNSAACPLERMVRTQENNEMKREEVMTLENLPHYSHEKKRYCI